MSMIVTAIVSALVLYYYLAKFNKYWSNRGVDQGEPVVLFGHNLKLSFRKVCFADLIQTLYGLGPGKRYSGAYQFMKPMLVLKDPELIKQITVKDFDYFMDHVQFIPDGVDSLFRKNLIALKGNKWRHIRATLSPSFTSSKIKNMYALITDAAKTFVSNLETGAENVVDVELKDLFARFTTDVIATTAFGIKIDSLSDRNNKFYLMGMAVVSYISSAAFGIKIMMYLLFPKLTKFLQLSLLDKKVTAFFRDLIKEAIATRETNGIIRPDMLNLLMEARKNFRKPEETDVVDTGFAESFVGKTTSEVMTDEDIAAQTFVFFIAGFDSVSALMCFMGYELAVNQGVQDKLRREILDILSDCEGNVTYEAVMKMKYLDMIVSETLRKWPSLVATARVCVKPYTIHPTREDEKPLHLKPNDGIWIPTFAIHRDQKYFPNSEKFDPERFSEENKDKIIPYTFMPFGTGPRNCIGSRFAILETKLVFFELLSKFQILPTKKSAIPLELSKKTITLNVEGGYNFGLKRI